MRTCTNATRSFSSSWPYSHGSSSGQIGSYPRTTGITTLIHLRVSISRFGHIHHQSLRYGVLHVRKTSSPLRRLGDTGSSSTWVALAVRPKNPNFTSTGLCCSSSSLVAQSQVISSSLSPSDFSPVARNRPETPNHALQRTAPGVTAHAPAACDPAAFPHGLRRPPQSLSLRSLGATPRIV